MATTKTIAAGRDVTAELAYLTRAAEGADAAGVGCPVG